ncbi:unnamed protein product [Cuscuta epithymum]|uniref:Pentatricopeptide repeat-containing protein n=1 Tax=Cuscuta epithymum TaxID=186058 RepID=A0AAV0ES81_9ASTE|nr:unnamed protein product [Cuscuta epithymum]
MCHKPSLSSVQTLIFLLQSCKESQEIRQVHGLMVKTGLDLVSFPLSKLLASSIRDTTYVLSIFKHIGSPTLFMFNTMLRSYSISDDPRRALILFNQMRLQRLFDQFTFIATLKSCARVSAIRTGLGVHSVLLRTGFFFYLNVMNSLLHFVCASGWIRDAQQLFDEFPHDKDLVSWNTLMGGYLSVHKYDIVIDLYKQMSSNGLYVSVSTILNISSAIGELSGRVSGDSIHSHCIKLGLSLNVNVASALISMYGKIGGIDSGRKIFDEAVVKDVVMWNCLIYGYARNRIMSEAFRLLRLMKFHGVKPIASTFLGLLSVSEASGDLTVGRYVHDYIKEQQLVLDATVGTTLIDMYMKCGFLKEAVEAFENIERKDSICWTSMIFAYGLHGQAENAISLFHRMEEEGCMPNEVTFLAVLSACSHKGLVAEGNSFFRRMIDKYSFSPKIGHYGCVIDLMGRSGLLEEAKKLTQSLPIKDDATMWRTLLAACRLYGNICLGEDVKRELEQRFDEHPADSVTLSSAYAIAGRIEDRARILEKAKGKLMERWISSPVGKKEVGFSRVNVAVVQQREGINK